MVTSSLGEDMIATTRFALLPQIIAEMSHPRLKQRSLFLQDKQFPEPAMKKNPRWMKSMIAAAADCQTVLPFQRGAKKIPASLKAVVPHRPAAAAR